MSIERIKELRARTGCNPLQAKKAMLASAILSLGGRITE
jgi:hypothetical protein